MGGGSAKVALLILGKGWTADYLISLITSSSATLPYAATTRDGRGHTVPFTFEPDSNDTDAYKALPDADVVLITFPLHGPDQPAKLVSGYEKTRGHADAAAAAAGNDASSPAKATRWIFLGATSTWSRQEPTTPDSPWDRGNARAQAEEALLLLGGERAVVPCLAGLWGGERQPRGYARGGRLAKTKADVKRRGAVHFVHGEDVGRGLLALVTRGVRGGSGWEGLGGRRWIVTDLRCYDWWDLLSSWDGVVNEDGYGPQGERVEYARWVGELMLEEGIAVLPREPGLLGRVLDGREWWARLGVWPAAGRLV